MKRPSSSRDIRTSATSGFSLVELMVVFTILTISLAMFSRTLTSASRLDPLSRERILAAEAANNLVERMRGYAFEDLYTSFNANPADDPGGVGTALGNLFDVEGLVPVGPGQRVGEIVFCDFQGQIREDSDLPEFGLPRDLSGDGIVDKEDHTGDCILLPFKVVVRWASRYGDREFELFGVLANL